MTEELLNANVLPHLTTIKSKLHYLSHVIGLVFNYLFHPQARNSLVYDKDHMGGRDPPRYAISCRANKRVDVCGPLLGHPDGP